MNSVLARGLLTISILWAILYAAGSLVYHRNVKVNYTRKIIHFSIFFLPLLMGAVFPSEKPLLANFVSFLAILMTFVLCIAPIRTRVPFVERAFLAMDRPEDRPHTLRWFFINMLSGLVVIGFGGDLLSDFGYEDVLVLVPVIAAMGDGLAEPVGVRFGKHRYGAYTLFGKTEKRHYRTLEGSAAVLVTTFIVVLFSHAFFTTPELVAALAVVPITMTVAEAISPHTIDTPFLLFFACTALLVAKQAA